MKYQILFTHQGNGVWAIHDTLEKAQNHINILVGMTSGINTLWSISYDGKEIRTNKKVKIGGVAQR